VRSVGGTFRGTFADDNSAIEGIWKQSGVSLPLVLERGRAPQIRRPQEPAEPYPYLTDEVRYESASAAATLAGTLTVPDSTGPFPAVLLISGSGQQDRDETVFGHRPFLVLADYLTRRGVAVLRVDDRGVGGSTGDVTRATSEDFADDALAGVQYLKARHEIDPERIGLLGHSEGALIAAMVAARSADVAFLVMLAGTGLVGEEILYRQAALIAEANGASEEAISRNRAAQEDIFRVLKEESSGADTEAGLREIMREALGSLTEEERAEPGVSEETIEAQLRPLLTPWFRFFLTYDPRVALREVTCPVLAVNGEKDLQVPAPENLAAIQEALEAGGNSDYAMIQLDGLNHLFQTATTGSPSEYGRIEETMSPSALAIVADWILAHVGGA
jgi:hypothetical protein